MSETAEETRTPGPAEMSALSVLQKGWRSVTIEHRGPDGTEVLAMLIFFVCPICAATVAQGNEENDLQGEHTNYHVRQARDFDVLNQVIEVLRGQGDG